MYRANYGMEYTVLRYPNVFGPRQDPKGEAGVVAIFTGQMLAGRQVVINGDGEQERDFVYVGDCAHANLLAITHPHPSGVYNLGSASGTNINQIFQVLKDITGYSKEAVHGPAKLGETRKIYLDASKAQQQLDWQPRVGFLDGMKQTVDYFQKSELPS
jgi:UDP-glucose 4-epimerase